MEAHKFNGEVCDINLSEHLRMGQFVDVEIKAVRRRFHTTLVGFKEPNYLIVELPDVKKYGYLKDDISDQAIMVVRTIFEKTSGECIAFTSRAMTKLTFPDKLLFLSFPTDIISKELRKEPREVVSISAKMCHEKRSDDDHKVMGIITNISRGGCHFELEASNIAAIKKERVVMEFSSPKNHSQLNLLADVRSQRKEGSRISVGLSFCEGYEYPD